MNNMTDNNTQLDPNAPTEERLFNNDPILQNNTDGDFMDDETEPIEPIDQWVVDIEAQDPNNRAGINPLLEQEQAAAEQIIAALEQLDGNDMNNRGQFGKIKKPYRKFLSRTIPNKGIYFNTRFGEQKLRDDATGLYLKGPNKMYLYRWK